MDEQFSISQQQAAWLLNTTDRTIRTWQDLADNPLPVAVRGGRGRHNEYDPQAVVSWYVARKAAEILTATDGIDPKAARARLDSLRADQIEFDLTIKRGEYAPIEALAYAVGDMAGQIRAIFEGIPKRIKQSLPALRAREIKILEREIVKAMNAVAEIQTEFDIEDENEGAKTP